MQYYGAHVSVSNGMTSAANVIRKAGGNFFQIFISNPRTGKWKERPSDEITKLNDTLNNHNMKMVIQKTENLK